MSWLVNIKSILCWLLVLSSFSLTAQPKVAVTEKVTSNKVLLNGYIEAITEATVSAQVSAEVKQIYVDVEDRVSAGALLLELDDKELKSQLAKANAALLAAKAQRQSQQSEFERLQRLSANRFVSDNDMTKAKSAVEVSLANIEAAEAEIAHVRQMLTYTKIIAPYSGVVTSRHVEPGEMVQPGSPLLSGFALQQSRLTLDVPSSLISHVEKSGKIEAQMSDGDWLSLANLTIAPQVDKDTDTVMVRANVDKKHFPQRPGSFIKVAVNWGIKKRLYVPWSSVFYQGDLAAVYVQVGSSVALRQIIVGEVDGGLQEVISGLQKDEQVIVDASRYLASMSLSSAER